MRTRTTLLLSALFLAPLGAALGAEPPPAKKIVEDPVAGVWRVKSFMKEGKETIRQMPEGSELEFGKGKLLINLGPNLRSEYTYSIRATTEPASIDLIAKEGWDKGKTVKCIYSVDGKQAILCMAYNARCDRPKDFRVSSDTIRLVLERKHS